jgi:hypothetical protein
MPRDRKPNLRQKSGFRNHGPKHVSEFCINNSGHLEKVRRNKGLIFSYPCMRRGSPQAEPRLPRRVLIFHCNFQYTRSYRQPPPAWRAPRANRRSETVQQQGPETRDPQSEPWTVAPSASGASGIAGVLCPCDTRPFCCASRFMNGAQRTSYTGSRRPCCTSSLTLRGTLFRAATLRDGAHLSSRSLPTSSRR